MVTSSDNQSCRTMIRRLLGESLVKFVQILEGAVPFDVDTVDAVGYHAVPRIILLFGYFLHPLRRSE